VLPGTAVACPGMIRAVGISAFVAIALAMPMQEAAAQDPVGGAIVGGATGAIVGGVLGGGRGAAIGAIIGGATSAAIGAEGEPRPGGYRYYQDACYQQQPDGAWLAISPEYCAAPYAEDSTGIAVDIAPPPLPVYDQPPIPAPGYIWTPGYWAWNDDTLLDAGHVGVAAGTGVVVDARILGLERRRLCLS
jgi:WXXGXW repeat (2 copies)